jgi:hypothetical protein
MKSFWTILITVLVTGGLVGGGTYYYLNKKATDDKKNLQSQIDKLNKKLTTTKSTATINPGWQKFTSNQFNYSIEYPANLTAQIQNNNDGTVTGTGFSEKNNTDNSYVMEISSTDIFDDMTVQVNGQDQKVKDISFETYVSNLLPGQGTDKITSVKKISTNSGTIYEVSYYGVGTHGATTSTYAYYSLSPTKYLMMYPDSNTNLPMFDQMLATFRSTK